MESKQAKVVIFGITGQDGSYLRDLYKDAIVYGFARGSLPSTYEFTKLDLAVIDISELAGLIDSIRPDYIYNFAGQSSVGESLKNPGETFVSNYYAHFKLLEACSMIRFSGRIYSALSSEMIGHGSLNLDSGALNCLPVSPYGLSKLACYNLNKSYRLKHGLNIVDGILFNHESIRRRTSFLFGKILENIRNGQNSFLCLGDLSVKRNFGHAEEYMNRVRNHMHFDERDYCICLTEVDYTLSEIINLFILEGNLNQEMIKRDVIKKRPHELECINVTGNRKEFSDLSHGPSLVRKLLQELS